jgi:hypothetical protein
VLAGALAAFFAVLVLLAYQSRTARLSATATPRPLVAAAPPRQVIRRRVIVTRVITELRDDDAARSAPVQVVSVPVSRAPAPLPAAPAPAPPAAPAPAPLTTQTS